MIPDNTRRYDIDWLRVIAIGLLIIYHIGIAFQPWGVFIGFIQNEDSLLGIWPAMAMLNVWRIPLLFFVSGMGVCFAMRKRNWKVLMIERSRRILLPLIFGMIAIVPIHSLIWQKYYSQDLTYMPALGHLWFLANIFMYVLLLSPLFFWLKRNESGKFSLWLKKVIAGPQGLVVIALFFIAEALILKPESFETYYVNLHGFLIGLLAFCFGFICVFSGKGFWDTVLNLRWLLLLLSIGLYLIRLILFDLKSPLALISLESTGWILTVFGFGFKYLNKPGKVLSYLSQAAYPVYIIHMVFIYLGSTLIVPLDISAWYKLVLLSLFTFTGCYLCFEIIKRIKILRPLFGLKK